MKLLVKFLPITMRAPFFYAALSLKTLCLARPTQLSMNSGESLALPPKLKHRSSAQSLLPPSSSSARAPPLLSGATTALTLQNVEQGDGSGELYEPSIAQSVSSPKYSLPSSLDDNVELASLARLLPDIMVTDRLKAVDALDFNVLTENAEAFDEEFFDKRVAPYKGDDTETFREKLKNVFILSSAGKPIYSLNGSENVVLGHMALITTIVATFQETVGTEVQRISSGDSLLVVLNRPPLILAARTKVRHELSNCEREEAVQLEAQLVMLYECLVGMLSRNAIIKNFENRMNFDLRRMLTPNDFKVLDSVCMNVTYGLSHEYEDFYMLRNSCFISHLLGNARQGVRMTHHLRKKLNLIFLSAKQIKTPAAAVSEQRWLARADEGEIVAGDLLFGFLCLGDKIISHLRPLNHSLLDNDVRTLLTIVRSALSNSEENTFEWIPVCLPNFNDLGFLHAFTQDIVIGNSTLCLVLLSANKNSFTKMMQVSEYIRARIFLDHKLVRDLASELELCSSMQPILRGLRVPYLKHFICHNKKYNEFVMDDLDLVTQLSVDGVSKIRALLHLSYFYTSLKQAQASEVRGSDGILRRLTYTRWQTRSGWVTGFLIADERYDILCLAGGTAPAQELINQGVHIRGWCDRYRRRLFIGDGVTF